MPYLLISNEESQYSLGEDCSEYMSLQCQIRSDFLAFEVAVIFITWDHCKPLDWKFLPNILG